MKETGRRISNMGKVLRPGQTVPSMTVNTSMAKSMARVVSRGPMVALTLEILKTTIFRVTEPIIGLMEEYLKAPGTTIKWKDKVYSHGQMAEDMKVTTKMIKKRAMVFSTGQMAGNTMEAGKMENSMAWAHTPQPVENPSKASGKKEKDFTGFQVMELNNDF